MCVPALPLCLLLWILQTTQAAVVTAPAKVNAVAGDPAHLRCNITTQPEETVHQVRWHNPHSNMILAYLTKPPIRIVHQDANLKVTVARKDSSYITIKKVGPDDEGCFHCFFDVYPSGKQQGTTCITITGGRVSLEGNRTAIRGLPVTLSCSYPLIKRVAQALWRKTTEQGNTVTVASYAKVGSYMGEQFKGRVSLSPTLGETRLTIEEVQVEDEACYTCEFHTYPDGTRKAVACLHVYVLPKPEVSHSTSPSGVTEANCTAQSRPPSTILWEISVNGVTLGPPVSSVHSPGNGTTIVTSTLRFRSALRTVKCVVQHPGLEKALTLYLKADDDEILPVEVSSPNILLIVVCVIATVFILGLCVFICKRFICI
ncbi:OX-2 membrane glycoprotein-like [Poeciliopsis prolifica]|uniref:OX-2 membrane glycoprotein-like n=1 Tax=Poeciliopsis prolifica TaxID=188132 RepID=UPI002413DDF3|nr:OX-2 membrane glycoprotein-like [Poeciliopsis prolifica]XP_054915015.1 OX-2 membrane glycoprotein-like [Poeciliopsis prolifica]XP_054915016.1 OX-2 membrane glycoprotein-like [Poeciliopsis prolifica]XP_054915018.1 OX-2 membrane glycoprotein-like [Poeciliopsis prolifica]XP_054915019.1 OX-2 membrane glycoprotein-like [Poeciliopsis prolifica]